MIDEPHQKTEKKYGGAESVDRALRIVKSFEEGDQSLSLTDFAKRTGYYRSTILRLIESLIRAGFLKRNSDKSYSLGSEFMRLGALYQRAFNLEAYVRPVLQRLRDETGESASFYVREGDKRTCLFRENSLHQVSANVREGSVLPLGRGAAGAVLSRFGEKMEPAQLLRLFDELPFIEFGDQFTQAADLAVPVYSSTMELVAALAIAGPNARFTADRLDSMGALLLFSGRELSGKLGGGAAWPT